MAKKIVVIVFVIVGFVLAFYAGILYQWMATTEIISTKDYSEIYVAEDELVDWKVFIEPTGEYIVLEQIDEPIRKTIALYMKANNFKLCSGKHRFNRINGTLDDYLNNEFKFERIR